MSPTETAEQACLRRVREAISRALQVDLQAVPADAAQGVFEQWDSLGHLSVVMEVEAEFGESLSVDEAVGLRSVADIVNLLKQRGHAA